MTVKVKEEWRAVASSGRIVTSFGTRELAKSWRRDHPGHAVKLVRAVTVEMEEPEWP